MDREPCSRCGEVHQWCTAHRKDGHPCGRRPRTGAPVCRQHGGGAPQVKAAAERREREAETARQVATLGLPRDVDPGQALVEEVHRTAGRIAWLEERVRQIPEAKLFTDTIAGKVPHELERMLLGERRHLVWVTTAALRAGVDERRVKVAEQMGELAARLVVGLVDDLGLTGAERERAVALGRSRFLLLAGGGEGAKAG